MSYDATAEPNEFFADSREEAVGKAVAFFGTEESELKICDLEDVFGLGARVVLVAVPKNAAGGARRGNESGDRDRGRDRDRDRGRGRDRGRDRDRDRGRDRDSGGRGGRASAQAESAPAESAPAESAPAEASPAPVESKGTARGDTSETGEYILGIVERMCLGDFELTETEEDDFIVVQLVGAAADRLGAQDRAVGALQLLANQAVLQGDDDPKRVVVDCDGDSSERESFLERTAGRAARRAKDSGRSVALDPMNGRDRRALHMAVREIEGVATMSVGTGRYRQVVLVPEGAPEYDEAVSAAREAEEKD